MIIMIHKNDRKNKRFHFNLRIIFFRNIAIVIFIWKCIEI